MQLSHNLEQETLENENFRKVIVTTPYQQLVLMSIVDRIDREIHPYTDQFLRIEDGIAAIKIGEKTFVQGPGTSCTVPANHYHEVINIGDKPLKLYTIYAPPHHPKGLVQKYKPIE
jgi:mannose-6-phosphate isomerase-like protein (cupin superfamily)